VTATANTQEPSATVDIVTATRHRPDQERAKIRELSYERRRRAQIRTITMRHAVVAEQDDERDDHPYEARHRRPSNA
jgi:hypothetical protein